MAVQDPPVAEVLTDAPDSGNIVTLQFTRTSAIEWAGSANCKHGITRNISYVQGALNHAAMVEATYRQHEQLLGTECPRDTPLLNATVTFAQALAVQPGQQRYISQQSAVIQPPGKNVWWGPGLTCAVAGAYQLVGKVQLAKGLAAGARGFGVIVVSGAPVLNVPMVDVGGLATANINAMLNLLPNQSVNVGYENTSASSQDVTVTTLTISAVWVP